MKTAPDIDHHRKLRRQRFLRPRPNDLPALGLDTDDLKIAMQINGRLLLRDLLAHGRGDLRRGYSLLWFL
jgi:hypothetical protein